MLQCYTNLYHVNIWYTSMAMTTCHQRKIIKLVNLLLPWFAVNHWNVPCIQVTTAGPARKSQGAHRCAGKNNCFLAWESGLRFIIQEENVCKLRVWQCERYFLLLHPSVLLFKSWTDCLYILMFLRKERAPTNSCGVATLSQNSQHNRFVFLDEVWFRVVYVCMVEWIGCISCHTSFVVTGNSWSSGPPKTRQDLTQEFIQWTQSLGGLHTWHIFLSNESRVVLFVNPANGDSWNWVLCSITRAEVSRPSQNPSFQATQQEMFTYQT